MTKKKKKTETSDSCQTDTTEPKFSKIRSILWPIYGRETKKFFRFSLYSFYFSSITTF